MCIIVAKKKNVSMPSINILKNCFNNNPDGAGIMLAAKDPVWGFKGLMTFEAFESKLKVLRKRFGNLDKLAVVMHFRIGTHVGNIPENTHPFPLSTSYDNLRALEWTSKQGMAHNGIIHATSMHDDVWDENVSDTMVFVKRVAAPVSKHAFITKPHDLLDMLYLVADSKLAFMDGRGNLVTAGKFENVDGVLYSNGSYTKRKSYYTYTPNLKSYHSYYYDDVNDISAGSHNNVTYLPTSNEQEIMKEFVAKDYRLEYPVTTPFVTESGKVFDGDALGDFALDPDTDILYMWDSLNYDWVASLADNEYMFFTEDDAYAKKPN